MLPGPTTVQVNESLELLRNGETEARSRLIEHSEERLRDLARRMLKGCPRVKRWSDTDDVLQNSLLRLHRSLAEVRPDSARQFYGLAASQIRRELIDLARHYYGAEGLGANHDSGPDQVGLSPSSEPENLEAWTEFHEKVDRLPDEQKEVVGLLWYDGLTQPEAASVLNVSLATLKRRWQAARIRLHEQLKGVDFG